MWRKETESLKSGAPVRTYSSLPGLDKVDVKDQEVFEKDVNKLTMELFDLDQKSDCSDEMNGISNSNSTQSRVDGEKTRSNSGSKDIDDNNNNNDDDDSLSSDDVSDTDCETASLTNQHYKPQYTKVTENWIDMARSCGLQPSELTKQFIVGM